MFMQINNLKVHYPIRGGFFNRVIDHVYADDGITMEFEKGKAYGLVGESGCGKSTTGKSIIGLEKISSGNIIYEGEDVTNKRRDRKSAYNRDIQMIFQDPHACLNPRMTVGQSISDPLFIHRLATPTAAKNQVLEMLERVGLTPVEEYYERYPSDLSGGQQQRVAIARALITRPKLVICDEPVSMLDASVQTQVLELMLELKRDFDLTYLFITHDLWVARFFCDRIAVMNSGKIVEINSTHQVFTNPQHPYTQTLLKAAPLLARK